MTRAARARARFEAASFLWTEQLGAARPTRSERGHSRLLRGATLGVLMALGACDSGGDSGPPVPLDDLPRLWAEALCGNIGPCCQEAGYPFDPGQCHATAEAQMRQSLAVYSTLNVTYSASAARSCVDSYAQAARACTNTDEVNTSCSTVFTGTLPEGAVCTQSAECTTRSCPSVPDGGVRQCTTGSGTRIHAKLGETCGWTCTTNGNTTSCSGTGNSSAPSCYTNEGLYCDAARVCASVPMLGQACTANAPCAGDAFCEGGVCVAQRTTGSCATTSNACASSAFCDTATRQCLPRKSSGETCTSTRECQTSDQCSRPISADAGSTTGTCRRRTIASQSLCAGSSGTAALLETSNTPTR